MEKMIHAGNDQGTCLLDIEIVQGVTHARIPIVSFINNFRMTTVQNFKIMQPVSIVLLCGTTHNV